MTVIMQNSCVCFPRRAPLRVYLASLRQEVLQIRRAHAPLPHAHRREALQLSDVWKVLHQERPPDQTCPATRRLPSQHAAGRQRGQTMPLLRVPVLIWLWRPKSRRGVRHVYAHGYRHRMCINVETALQLRCLHLHQLNQPTSQTPISKDFLTHVTMCNSTQKYIFEPDSNPDRSFFFPDMIGIY